jgi:hypothetical protein
LVIALLAVLGVELIVIVALLVFILGRKRWVTHQPGAFRGAIRVVNGDIDGVGAKWSRGYGHWVRDVLVWTKAPFLFRNQLLAADGLHELRAAQPHEIKRLGDHPVIVQVGVGTATVELAAGLDDTTLLLGPYPEPVEASGHAEPAPTGSAVSGERS